ncbi:MAG: SPFH domain-containing protein [Ilumatobacteraceae bacterium]|jgi:regulator of protease activity HflC (stomatin/prohibitin superfamily)|nr:SPFH domain-containing protein [Ilumatobacteraceae bacterium]
MVVALIVIGVVVLLVLIVLANTLHVIDEYERAVFFRLGHLRGTKGPGLIVSFPLIDRFVRVGLRTVALEIPVQELVTTDNVTVRVNGVTYYRVHDPVKAVVSVQDYQFATAQVSQVTLLTVLRQVDLDSLLREREQIGTRLRSLIDDATEPWGVEVTMVEIKDVELPEQMRRAMAREAESERERRAKVIHARGELEAAEALGKAAVTLEAHPAALQLRTLSTLSEIAVERNSTIVFPLPVEVMRMFEAITHHLEGDAAPE